jgi:quercetin dioxygenase-like cupin family protein
MICYHEKIEKQDLGGGILFQYLGIGENMNVFHWNMADKSVVPLHQHPEEQFGYVIKGGFEIIMGDETFVLKAGDAYFIPPNVLHSFVATGETEAIDVFNPTRKTIPGQG